MVGGSGIHPRLSQHGWALCSQPQFGHVGVLFQDIICRSSFVKDEEEKDDEEEEGDDNE